MLDDEWQDVADLIHRSTNSGMLQMEKNEFLVLHLMHYYFVRFAKTSTRMLPDWKCKETGKLQVPVFTTPVQPICPSIMNVSRFFRTGIARNLLFTKIIQIADDHPCP